MIHLFLRFEFKVWSKTVRLHLTLDEISDQINIEPELRTTVSIRTGKVIWSSPLIHALKSDVDDFFDQPTVFSK